MDRAAVARFGLIGCGAIGSALDEGAATGIALTHAGAITRSPRARLVAVCDSDLVRAESCAARRGAPAVYGDFRSMLAREPLDAVSIATPPADRLAMVEAAIAAGVRLIWCEKPMAVDLSQAVAIQALAARRGIPVAVNYLRRWTTPTRRLIETARSGALGSLQAGTAYYGKGLLNNGSHLLDLLNGALGLPCAVEAAGIVEDDRVGQDETLSATLQYPGGGAVRIVATDHRQFSLFELDLLFARGRLRLTEKGDRLDVATVGPDPVFPGYESLGDARCVAGGLDRAFAAVLDQLLGVLADRSVSPSCAAADGAAALAVVEAVRLSRGQGGRTVAITRRDASFAIS